MGLSALDREALRKVTPELLGAGPAFVDDFYDHLRKFSEPAGFLRSDEFVERLKKTQLEYFRSLIESEPDWDYVLGRLRIGSVHHRVGLKPKWYIASFSLSNGTDFCA
jgi:hypothetical protein